MVKTPAGTTTISGQSGQSRKTVPGARSAAAATGAVASVVFIVPCTLVATADVSAIDRQNVSMCFITSGLPEVVRRRLPLATLLLYRAQLRRVVIPFAGARSPLS